MNRTVTTSKGRTIDLNGVTDAQWDTVCRIVACGAPRACMVLGGLIHMTSTYGERYRVAADGEDNFSPRRDNLGRN